MRADRLISALMVLQTRGKITAAELAAELEVSERTARRDLEALAISGVPIYSTHGRGGGWQLVGGATTDLTGLSSEESRALFLAAGPALDSTPELKSAMRKLTTALPEIFREEAAAASSAVKIDPNGWGQIGQASTPPFLDALTNAVVDGHQIEIDYESPRSARSTRVVHPLGLVTKRGVWYLIAHTDRGGRTYRVTRILSVEKLGLPVERPADFDLDETWNEIVTEVESQRLALECRAHVDPAALTALRWQFRSQLVEHGELADGRLDVSISDYNEFGFAGQIAGHGKRVELVDPPPEVLRELRRIAGELTDMYPSDGEAKQG